MKRIVLRSARTEAALLRFDAWWQARLPRERVLLSILAGVAALALLVGGLVRPIIAARADARADIRGYETLMARVRAAGTLSGTPAPALATGTPEASIQAAAGRAGIVANVVAADGGWRASVADGGYDAVVRWIDDVARTAGLSVHSVSLVRGAAPGRVAASVEFRS